MDVTTKTLDHENCDSYFQSLVYHAVRYGQTVHEQGGDPFILPHDHASSMELGLTIKDQTDTVEKRRYIVSIEHLGSRDFDRANQSFRELFDGDFDPTRDIETVARRANQILNANT